MLAADMHDDAVMGGSRGSTSPCSVFMQTCSVISLWKSITYKLIVVGSLRTGAVLHDRGHGGCQQAAPLQRSQRTNQATTSSAVAPALHAGAGAGSHGGGAAAAVGAHCGWPPRWVGSMCILNHHDACFMLALLAPNHVRRTADMQTVTQAVRQQGGGAAPHLFRIRPHPLPRDRGDPVAAGAVPHPRGQRRMRLCWHSVYCVALCVADHGLPQRPCTDPAQEKTCGRQCSIILFPGNRWWRCRPSARAPTRCWRSSSAASASPTLIG